MLSLYRSGLRLRRGLPDGELEWLSLGEGVLAFRLGTEFTFALNFSATPVPLPPGEILLASGPVGGGELPTDTAIWLRS
jgi:alpha-glucosidase